MKKLLQIAVIFIFAFLWTFNSFAQLPGAPVGLSKGIKGGLNFANYRGSDVSGTSSRKTLVVGGFVKINLLNIIALQPEVLYSGKGAKVETSSSKITDKIAYLEIPILLRVNTINAGVLKAGLIGGPSFAFRLSAKRTTEANGQSNETDLKDVIKSNDVGAVIGIGVDLGAGVISLVGDIRYTLGLSSIDDSSSNLDIKNGVLSTMVGIAF